MWYLFEVHVHDFLRFCNKNKSTLYCTRYIVRRYTKKFKCPVLICVICHENLTFNKWQETYFSKYCPQATNWNVESWNSFEFGFSGFYGTVIQSLWTYVCSLILFREISSSSSKIFIVIGSNYKKNEMHQAFLSFFSPRKWNCSEHLNLWT